jgi:hypothetical protein
MPPEEPGAPGPAPGDAAGTATFRPGVEPADSRSPADAVDERAPSGGAGDGAHRKTPPRRRLLDDPDDDAAPRRPKAPKVRARKVRRVVRHIEPWSVLKISVLFFLSIFLIICVASAVLWNTARSAGVIDDVESFITSLGFGNCEDIEGEDAAPATSTTISGADPQVTGPTSSTTVPVEEPVDERSTIPDEDGECAEGQVLVGGFEFEDERIFQSFALGGIVLVLSGAAFSVVMVLLFNLISDLTGGVRVTVLEEEPTPPRRRPPAEGPAERDPAR